MNEISLIIRVRDKHILDYATPFLPLLRKTDGELIIITRENQRLEIPYDYSIFDYSESHGNFINFCLASTLGNKVIVIEEGQVVTPKIVEGIEKFLFKGNCNNLACNYKIYLDSAAQSYYTHKDVIVYNRGVMGFNEDFCLNMEDYSLIDTINPDIEKSILRLLKDSSYRELYIWYSDFVLINLRDYENEFYEILEREKQGFNFQERKKLEEIFLNTPLNNKYTEFLKIKKTIRENENSSTTIIEMLSRLQTPCEDSVDMYLMEGDKYYSWLIYDALIYKKNLINLLSHLKEAFINSYISYLFNTREDFYKVLYDYLLIVDYSSIKAKGDHLIIDICINLLKHYIESMRGISCSMEGRKMLLWIFNLYADLNLFLYRKGKIDIHSELNKYFTELERIFNSISSGDIENAIIDLEDFSDIPHFLEIPTRYYIQELRQQNNIYPYTLSICMIVKDEEKNIERCLKSIKPLLASNLAELIVVDTGSIDGTVNICRGFTENIYFSKWSGHFSKARNYSISIAKGKYIFILDADEEFKPSELQKLIEEFEGQGESKSKRKDNEKYNTFTLKIKNFTNPEYSKFVMFSQHLIFKNDGNFYYTGSIHNQPIFYTPVKNLDITLFHFGYIMTPELSEKKFQRTATLLKRELQKSPRDIYYRYQLSTSCAAHGDTREAIRQTKISLRYIRENGTSSSSFLQIYNNAAMIHMNNCYYKDTIEICDEALKINPRFIDFLYYKAVSLLNIGSFTKAVDCLNAYLSILENFSDTDIINNGYSLYTLDLVHEVIGMLLFCNYRLSNYDRVVEISLELQDIQYYTKYLDVIVNSFLRVKKFKELIMFYRSKTLVLGDKSLEELFNNHIVNGLSTTLPEERTEFLVEMDSINFGSNSSKDIKSSLEGQLADPIKRGLLLIESVKPVEMDVHRINMIVVELMEILNTENAASTPGTDGIKGLKKISLFILRSLTSSSTLNSASVVELFSKYITYCSKLVQMDLLGSFEAGEKEFLINILGAISRLNEGRYEDTINLMKNAAIGFEGMEGAVEILQSVIIPENPIENPKLKDCSYNTHKSFLNDPSKTNEMVTSLIKEGNIKKAMEYHCFGKLAYQEDYDSKEEINEIINDHIPIRTDKEIRVLHGRIDIENQMSVAVKALKERGIYARELNYYPYYSSSSADYIMDISNLYNPIEIMNKTANAASKLIPEYDIFHYYLGTSMMLDYSDLPLIKNLGRKIVMTFFRSDLEKTFNDEGIKKRLEFLSKYITSAIVHEQDLKELLENYIPDVRVIPKMIDTSEVKVGRVKYKNTKPLIVHMPSQTEKKGTKHILSAIEDLSLVFNFDFELLDEADLVLSELLIDRADLIIDNIISPSYGISSIRYMALGKPVINHISNFLKDSYSKDLPIINANPDDIEEKLKYVLENRDILRDLGSRGRSYIEKYHDSRKLIDEVLNLYNGL